MIDAYQDRSKIQLAITLMKQQDKFRERRDRLIAAMQDNDESLDVIASALDEIGTESCWAATNFIQEKEWRRKELHERRVRILEEKHAIEVEKDADIAAEVGRRIADILINRKVTPQAKWTHKDYPINHMCKEDE